MKLLITLFIAITSYFTIKKVWKKKTWILPTNEFPKNWRNILINKIDFYNQLNKEDRIKFEYKIQEFLLNCKITGIKTSVSKTDKVLIASSAIIPIFYFEDWKYLNINEVLLYPNAFGENYELEGKNRNILGMVGNKSLNKKMILSKKALHHGFDNTTDKKNTAIHEFVHLIDRADGDIDGIPKVLMKEPNVIPWLKYAHQEINKINKQKSDINPYGGTSLAEFLPVASEYFLERPKLFKKKHPELYDLFKNFYNTPTL